MEKRHNPLREGAQHLVDTRELTVRLRAARGLGRGDDGCR